MKKTADSLLTKESFDELVVTTFGRFINTRLESFSEQLNKLETIE